MRPTTRTLTGLALSLGSAALPATLQDPNPSARDELSSAEQTPMPPGPREKVSGLSCLVLNSRIVFQSYPDHPHVLEVTLAFPGRVRSHLRSVEGRATQRTLTYRFGDQVWSIAAGSSESHAVTSPTREAALIELELRRALCLWPDGLAWNAAANGVRTADLGGLGRLDATIPEGAARPTSLVAFDTEGQPRESFQEIRWKKERGRWWPHRMEVHFREAKVWDEEVLGVDTGARFVDAWFVPPDRRTLVGTRPAPAYSNFDLSPMVFQRRALGPGLDVAEALEAADQMMDVAQTELREQGLDLDPSPHLELDHGGRPAAVLLVLTGDETTLPEGWTRLPGRPAVGRSLPAARVGMADMSGLRKAAGKAAEGAGSPLLRVQPADHQPRRAQLLLPLDG